MYVNVHVCTVHCIGSCCLFWWEKYIIFTLSRFYTVHYKCKFLSECKSQRQVNMNKLLKNNQTNFWYIFYDYYQYLLLFIKCTNFLTFTLLLLKNLLKMLFDWGHFEGFSSPLISVFIKTGEVCSEE